jgi:hypothetical protein
VPHGGQRRRRGAAAALAAVNRSGNAEHLRIVKLDERWADRKLLICVRDHTALPVHARELVAALS